MGVTQGYLNQLEDSGVLVPDKRLAATPAEVERYSRRQFLGIVGAAALGAYLAPSLLERIAYAQESTDQPKQEAKQMPNLPPGYREATPDQVRQLLEHLSDERKTRYAQQVVREKWIGPETRFFTDKTGRRIVPYEGGETIPIEKGIEYFGEGSEGYVLNSLRRARGTVRSDIGTHNQYGVFLDVERLSKSHPDGKIRRTVAVYRTVKPYPWYPLGKRRYSEWGVTVFVKGKGAIGVNLLDPINLREAWAIRINEGLSPEYTREWEEWISGGVKGTIGNARTIFVEGEAFSDGEAFQLMNAFIKGKHLSDERIRAGDFNQ